MLGSSDAQIFIHPTAICDSQQIGQGTRIWAFAHVLDGAVVGRNCNIGDHAFIESGARVGDRVTIKNQAMIWNGVTIEDDVFIGPGAIFTNDRYPRSPRGGAAHRYSAEGNWLVPTRVRRGASIGAGAIIVCGVTLGEYCSVGAGAIVTKDVPDFALVVGQPARQVGRVCKCGMPVDESGRCRECNFPQIQGSVAANAAE